MMSFITGKFIRIWDFLGTINKHILLFLIKFLNFYTLTLFWPVIVQLTLSFSDIFLKYLIFCFYICNKKVRGLNRVIRYYYYHLSNGNILIEYFNFSVRKNANELKTSLENVVIPMFCSAELSKLIIFFHLHIKNENSILGNFIFIFLLS